MAIEFLTIVRSARRSRIRRDIVLSLDRRKFAFAQQIADDIETEPWMVDAAIRGRKPYFAPSLSLLRLGLVKRVRSDGRPAYAITPLGARVAKRLRVVVL